ncbi:MAG: dephospho-CoA kinase [Coriobacteriales bacterium]|jgi:dephospho-CoA kinase|nr:dephospho-CoA kinase [Coriobacteriales bacterium]
MYVVLITGGLASGKKTVREYIGRLGATTLDLDAIAKEEQEDPLILAQIAEVFGEDVVDSEGLLIRPLLAQRAFASKEAADRLNAICWPPVIKRVADYILQSSCQPIEQRAILVIEVPLLAEAPALLDLKNEVISVVAPERQRIKRAIARGMREADVQNRLALQASDEQRVAISDTVFENSGSIESLYAQIDDWYRARIQARLF